jgi:hypothetical protein
MVTDDQRDHIRLELIQAANHLRNGLKALDQEDALPRPTLELLILSAKLSVTAAMRELDPEPAAIPQSLLKRAGQPL